MKSKSYSLAPLTVASAATGQEIQVVDYPELMKVDADVYIIFGMRSFGKSYGILQYCIDRWYETGEQFVVMRTIEDDITQGKLRNYVGTIKPYFDELVSFEKEMTVYQGKVNARSLEGKTVVREEIGSGMSLSGWLKYKGNNYDKVTTVIFEEFLERKQRLKPDEFMEGYLNNLSTVIRLRPGVKVFCLANTVKQRSPIFDYYHINLRKIRKGKVTLFSMDNGLKVCVYYTPDVELQAETARHYTVNQNRAAKMITSGEWEESEYPITWEGYTLEQAKDLRRFRAPGASLYISDLNLTVKLYGAGPIVIERPKSSKARQNKMTAKELVINYPEFSKLIHAGILTGNILTEKDCFIDIDNLIDRTF